MLTTLYNLFRKAYNGNDFDMYSEEGMSKLKLSANKLIDISKEFLQRLIENDHIEKIGDGEINDYIKYIATTEDPIQTLTDLLK